jgi:hypothetical protein
MEDNLVIDESVLDFIRGLKDFDLVMLLSEVDEHGWDKARALIPYIRKTLN